MKILADATLPSLDDAFPSPFKLTRYTNQKNLQEQLNKHEILICRSTLKVTSQLLKTSTIKVVATASSGIDHLDSHYLTKAGISVIDAKGCNAIAVADYILASLAYLKKYKDFSCQRVGIIGVGAVGSLVASHLSTLGYTVFGFDPLKPDYVSDSLETISQTDLICIHANLHETQPFPSKHLINQDFLTKLKPTTALLNAARGEIVDETALLKASNPFIYCTDVYAHEPQLNASLIDRATLATPHIAGHSVEAKERAVHLISQKLHAFYGLTSCSDTCSLTTSARLPSTRNWEDAILSWYNPNVETLAIKAATDKEKAFLQLRREHYRCEFS